MYGNLQFFKIPRRGQEFDLLVFVTYHTIGLGTLSIFLKSAEVLMLLQKEY
jgi:hypothetical protein